jgi:hypothetical protein
MKRTLIYFIAVFMFAASTAISTPKAHAAVDIFLPVDGGGGGDSGSSGSSSHKTTILEAIEVLLGIID